MLELNKKVSIKGIIEQIYKFPILSNICLRDQNGIECFFTVKTDKNIYKIGEQINLNGTIVGIFQPTVARELQYKFKKSK